MNIKTIDTYKWCMWAGITCAVFLVLYTNIQKVHIPIMFGCIIPPVVTILVGTYCSIVNKSRRQDIVNYYFGSSVIDTEVYITASGVMRRYAGNIRFKHKFGFLGISEDATLVFKCDSIIHQVGEGTLIIDASSVRRYNLPITDTMGKFKEAYSEEKVIGSIRVR